MRQNPFCSFLCLVSASAALLLSSCTTKPGGSVAGPIYEEASRYYRHNKYPEALDAWNRALAVDTLKGFSRQAVDALRQKSRVEYLTGEYEAAFQTFGILDNHAGNMLSDSLRASLLLDRARMHAEIGNFGTAAAVLGRIPGPDAWLRLEQAALWRKGGDFPSASQAYLGLSKSDDPAVRMTALSGLLDCAVARNDLGLELPEAYAGKIAGVSGKVMSMQAPPELRIRALRTAARSLQQLDRQRPNASFLLFRALALAQQENLTRLDQILQFESNAVIVRKPDVYRSVIEFFTQRNMPYSRMAALYQLGMSPGLNEKERIEALKSGLQICQNYGVPATAAGVLNLERDAIGTLEDLLIGSGRYFELFEVSEQAKLLELQREMQAGIAEFRLPAGHEALQNEIIELTRDISGLLQRKVNMADEGYGFELSALADKSISSKRGRLIELSAEAAAIDRGAASRLSLTPVTMMTVQKSLRPDEALVRFFIRDSLATGMLISDREMQIISSPVSRLQVRSQLATLRQTLSAGGPELPGRLRTDGQRLWLTDALLHSISERLKGYRHLVFVADASIPFHLLGQEEMLGAERRISQLGSAKEAVVYSGQNPSTGQAPGIAFFDASRPDMARIHKMYHPEDRIFLFWKPMSKNEIGELEVLLSAQLKRDASGSGSLRALASGAGGPQDGRWIYLTSYGID
jgi:hypothetical protein